MFITGLCVISLMFVQDRINKNVNYRLYVLTLMYEQVTLHSTVINRF